MNQITNFNKIEIEYGGHVSLFVYQSHEYCWNNVTNDM